MKKTVYVLKVKETSSRRPSYSVKVETFWLLGFIPVYQREILLKS